MPRGSVSQQGPRRFGPTSLNPARCFCVATKAIRRRGVPRARRRHVGLAHGDDHLHRELIDVDRDDRARRVGRAARTAGGRLSPRWCRLAPILEGIAYAPAWAPASSCWSSNSDLAAIPSALTRSSATRAPWSWRRYRATPDAVSTVVVTRPGDQPHRKISRQRGCVAVGTDPGGAGRRGIAARRHRAAQRASRNPRKPAPCAVIGPQRTPIRLPRASARSRRRRPRRRLREPVAACRTASRRRSARQHAELMVDAAAELDVHDAGARTRPRTNSVGIAADHDAQRLTLLSLLAWGSSAGAAIGSSKQPDAQDLDPAVVLGDAAMMYAAALCSSAAPRGRRRSRRTRPRRAALGRRARPSPFRSRTTGSGAPTRGPPSRLVSRRSARRAEQYDESGAIARRATAIVTLPKPSSAVPTAMPVASSSVPGGGHCAVAPRR